MYRRGDSVYELLPTRVPVWLGKMLHLPYLMNFIFDLDTLSWLIQLQCFIVIALSCWQYDDSSVKYMSSVQYGIVQYHTHVFVSVWFV